MPYRRFDEGVPCTCEYCRTQPPWVMPQPESTKRTVPDQGTVEPSVGNLLIALAILCLLAMVFG
jgi:hypothetical protein